MRSTWAVTDMNASRHRFGERLRWVFLRRRVGKQSWRELIPGLVILVVVALVNTTCEQAGMYERLEWRDLDRLQRTAWMTDDGGVFLFLIGDEEYRTFFDDTSPLDEDRVTTLIAAACAFGPRVVGVDILTGDWPPDFYETSARTKLRDCPIVWAWDVVDVESPPDGNGRRSAAVHRLGKVVGQASPPPGVCTAVPTFPRDADMVARRYWPWVVASPTDGPSPPPGRYWSMVSSLARYPDQNVCGETADRPMAAEPKPARIRFTSNDLLRSLPAGLLLEAAGEPGSDLHRHLQEELKDAVVILGGTYRHARDEHLTPLGFMPGPNLIANAVYTARSAPIETVHPLHSLAIGVAVGAALLIGLFWIGLRWLWATLASLILSGLAALVISWQLYNYVGYFFGVLGGLMGVVLAEFTSVTWAPLRAMWRNWLSEYPRSPSLKRKETEISEAPCAPAILPVAQTSREHGEPAISETPRTPAIPPHSHPSPEQPEAVITDSDAEEPGEAARPAASSDDVRKQAFHDDGSPDEAKSEA